MPAVRRSRRPSAGRLAPLLLLVSAGCGIIGEPPVWSSQELSLSVAYDTVPGPADASIPLRVQFDTVRNVAGYPLLYVTVTATNLSRRELAGTTGTDCGWWYRAFDNAELTGSPVWEETADRFCRDAALRLNLPVGGTQAFPRDFLPFDSITAVRGAGRYYFAARLHGSPRYDANQWLTEWLAAGFVDLVP